MCYKRPKIILGHDGPKNGLGVPSSFVLEIRKKNLRNPAGSPII
jgi:hypothetical protein